MKEHDDYYMNRKLQNFNHEAALVKDYFGEIQLGPNAI
jgi:hypothetical protein